MGVEVTGKNWYILFVQVEKQSQICTMLQNEGIHAFLPMMEYYRRDSKGIAVKPMFPGYVFVRSELEQKEFDEFLESRKGWLWGVIKQLKEDGTAAMHAGETTFFEHLLDEDGVARMSYGYVPLTGKKKGKAVVTDGPLGYFQERICKVDRHDKMACLDVEFRKQKVLVGLTILDEAEVRKKEQGREGTQGERAEETGKVEEAGREASRENDDRLVSSKDRLEDGTEIDIEELKSKMMGL
ncbi:transcription termination/antitermination NusG family protein [Roseburia hominis]